MSQAAKRSVKTDESKHKDEQRMKNLLKVRRWEVGMKQYELATRLHCSAPYLCLVENGRIDPPEEFKLKVADIFKIAVDQIFPLAEKAEGVFE